MPSAIPMNQLHPKEHGSSLPFPFRLYREVGISNHHMLIEDVPLYDEAMIE